MAEGSGVAQCLQRVADAEARLRTEFSNVEGILRDVQSAIAELERTSVTSSAAAEGTRDTAILSEQGAKTSSALVQEPAAGELASVAVDVTQNYGDEFSEVRDELADYLGLSSSDVSDAYRIFASYDKDNSGKLDVCELKTSLHKLSGKEIDENDYINVLKVYDKDMDGFVSFEEFLFIYCQTPAKKQKHLKRFSTRVTDGGNRLTSKLRARVGGIKQSDVKAYLRSELNEEASCLKLPLVLLTFFAFLFSCQLHRPTAILSGTEEAVKYHIEENANFAFSGVLPFENGRIGHKAIYDVNTFGDFWSFFGLGLVPLLFPGPEVSEMRLNVAGRCTPPADALLGGGFSLPNGSTVPASATLSNDLGDICQKLETPLLPPTSTSSLGRASPFLATQSIIAGVRLQQEQLPVTNCIRPELQGHSYDGECTDSGDFWFPIEIHSMLGMDKQRTDQPGASTEYLLSHTTQSEAQQRLFALENSAWLDQRTSKIEIMFTVYNPDTDIFTALHIYFGMNRAGLMRKLIKPMSFPMTTYRSPLSYVLDCLFYLCVIKLAIDEGRLMIHHCRAKGFKQGSYEYFGFAQVVDWAAILYSVVLSIFWAEEHALLTDLFAKLQSGDPNTPGTWVHAADRIEFFEHVDELVKSVTRNQLLFGAYPLLLGLRFFEAFSGQPRLALVTKTLSAASKDVIHFGLVVVSLLLVFSLSGQLMFGQDMKDYASYDRALVTLQRGMIEGFDVSGMFQIDRPLAVVWGLAFSVLLQVLMTNMLLAIIFDVYAEVKSAVPPDAETIWSQSWEIFRRWKGARLGQRISLSTVQNCLEALAGQREYLTVPVLMQNVPGLGKEQALRILVGADEKAANRFESMHTAQQLLSMDFRIQEIQLMLENSKPPETVGPFSV
eukprot:TRINITY_DN11040_c0_g3_i1.p1 TRINITY_DN11040_c0_g3~~TRINITY_DN11040_c0_g3_i1.p1  ORF type:complete len:892 (+),score=153.30 TRINITY_DN11040_c0_g3_i1:89-2764(+)